MAIQLPATARPRRRLSATLFWCVALASLLFAYLSLDERFLRDYWQHLAAARAAAEQGDWLLRRDALTFTIAGEPIVNSDWLAQRLYLWMHRAGELPLTRTVNAALLTIAFVALGLAARVRASIPAAALMAAVAAAGCALQSLTLRPQSFSVVLACLVVWVLEASRRRAVLRLWLLPMLALWPNLHGAFPIAWALLALDRIERLQQARAPGSKGDGSLAGRERNGNRWQALWWVDVACVAAPLAHPQGRSLILHLVNNAARSRSRGIMEWLPPALGQPAGVFLLLTGAATLVACVWLHRCAGSPGLARRVLVRALVLGAPACVSVRMVAWFGIGMALVWAESLAVAVHGRPSRGRSVPTAALLVPAAIILVALPWIRLFEPDGLGARVPASRRGPVSAVAWMRDQGATGRIWAPFDWGGVLEWELFGRVRLFADGRVHLYPDRVWKEYSSIEAGGAGALSVLDRHGVEWVLLALGRYPALEEALGAAQHWQPVYGDVSASVFRRAAHAAPPSSARAAEGPPFLF